MRQAIRSFPGRLEEIGKLQGTTKQEHAKRFLSFKKETAETAVLLMKIASARNIVEVGTSNGQHDPDCRDDGRLAGRIVWPASRTNTAAAGAIVPAIVHAILPALRVKLKTEQHESHGGNPG